MHNYFALLWMPIVLLFICQPTAAEEISHWTSKSFNMAESGSMQWNWPDASKIEKLYPLGISEQGWFAHSSKLDGTEIFLSNLDCKDGCLSDGPDEDKCGCLFEAGVKDLKRFGIRPFENPQKGTFPARLSDDEYRIEIIYKEKAIYSIARVPGEKSEPEFPGSYIYLVSKNKDRKQIGLINHNHMGIMPGVRPAGWIKCPLSDRLVVFILCGRDYEGSGCPQTYYVMPLGVHLGG